MSAVIAVVQNNLQIVPLSERPELADTCAAWSFGEWGCLMEGRTLELAVENYRRSATDQGLPKTWVCLVDGKPAGIIRLKKDDHPDRTDLNPWLGSLFVHPRFRGQGVAKALCGRLEKEAREQFDFETLYLFTADAGALYRSLGWQQIGTVRDPMGVMGEEVLMHKKLRDAAHV